MEIVLFYFVGLAHSIAFNLIGSQLVEKLDLKFLVEISTLVGLTVTILLAILDSDK
mgnify:CR=1 FL=1